MKNYFGCNPRGVGARKNTMVAPPALEGKSPPPQPTSPGGINPLLKIPPVKNHPPPPLPGGGGGTGIELMLTPPPEIPPTGEIYPALGVHNSRQMTQTGMATDIDKTQTSG